MSLTTRNEPKASNYLGNILRVLSHPRIQQIATAKTMQLLQTPKKRKKKRAFAPAQATRIPTRTQQVTAPIAQNSVRLQGGPMVKNLSNNQSIRVRHSERFASLVGSALFSSSSYPLQPGLGTGSLTMFPWLAGIARQYETYKFHSCSITFKTISATSLAGHVSIAPDYDALDAPPTTGVEAESYKSSVSGPVWQNLTCRLDPADMARRAPKYVRVGAAPAVSDLKTYDVANIHINSEDCPATDTLGYLYVNYDVEFFTPARPATLAMNQVRTLFNTYGSDFTSLTKSLPGANMFVASIDSSKQMTINFAEPGKYMIRLEYSSLVSPDFFPPIAIGANASFLEPTSTGRWIQELHVESLHGQVGRVFESYVILHYGTVTVGSTWSLYISPHPGTTLHA